MMTTLPLIVASPGQASVPNAAWRSVGVWLTVLTAVRLLAASVIPLTEDEAYYQLWARHPGFGYFDHPPMVAWWIAAGQALVGGTPLGARLISVLATALVSMLIIDTGRTLNFGEVASQRAGLWYNATILIGFGGAIITPDAPATLFWTLTLWTLAKARGGGGGRWWAAAGAAAGLAALSKYSALFIAPGTLLWLLSSRAGRMQLRRPGPWAALLIASVVFAPNIVWNMDHHWLSFSKQFSRIAPSAFTPLHAFDFPATQFILLNPVIAIFMIRGLLTRPGCVPAHSRSLLVLMAAPFTAYLFLHSLHAGIQAHWPAPLYPSASLLAALGAQARVTARWRRLARATPWIGFSLSALALLHMAAPRTDWLGRKDPVMPLRGWRALAANVESRRIATSAGWVGAFSYGGAAELMGQDVIRAPIVELIERERYAGLGPAPRLKGVGVVVDLARRVDADDLSPCFDRVERLAPLYRGDPGLPGVAYSVFVVANPKVDLVRRGCRVGKDKLSPPESR